MAERARFWSALAEDDGRTWTFDADGVRGPCVVSLSGEEAAAVLDALVGNVFAHTPEGTPYALRLRADGAWVTLDVEDDGPGIDAPDEAVGRGETRSGSTGLGLDIASPPSATGTDPPPPAPRLLCPPPPRTHPLLNAPVPRRSPRHRRGPPLRLPPPPSGGEGGGGEGEGVGEGRGWTFTEREGSILRSGTSTSRMSRTVSAASASPWRRRPGRRPRRG